MNPKYTFMAVIFSALIIIASSIPDHSLWGDGSLTEQIIYNFAHIPVYALLTFLCLKSFERREDDNSLMTVVLVLAGVILFAVSDEIHQSFVSGRSASFADAGLDGLGIFFGLSALKLFKRLKTS